MPDQTAMLLTQEEWDDLETMVEHYRSATDWAENDGRSRVTDAQIANITRRRDLAERIIQANS